MWPFSAQAKPVLNSHVERSFDEAREVEKSKSDYTLIKKSIESNNLFTCLDQQQIENFVNVRPIF